MEKRRECCGLEGTPSRLAAVSWLVDAHADGMISFDMDDMLFGGLVPGGQQRQESWTADPVAIDAGLEELLAGSCEVPARAERLSAPAHDPADSETRSDESGEEEKELEDGGPTSAELAALVSRVVTVEGSRAALR